MEEKMKRMAQTALEYAKDFQKDLDYSRHSIEDLEEILDYCAHDVPISKPTEKQIWSMSIIWGAYLGETLLKNALSEKGYEWVLEDGNNIPLLKNVRNTKAYACCPVDKVYKRLINGEEDNVVSFYDVVMDML